MTVLTKPPAQDAASLKQVWADIGPESCPHHYNFHLHTVCSDGQLTPEGLIQQAVTLGLKALAITDHHCVRGNLAAQRWLADLAQARPHQVLPQLWTGMEVTCQLQGCEVHILGYAFEPEHEAIAPYLLGDRPLGHEGLAENVVAALHQAGGLAVLAHPCRYPRSAEELIPAAAAVGIDGTEVYYSYSNSKPWKPTPQKTELVRELAQKYGLWMTCGTDTHGLNLLLRH